MLRLASKPSLCWTDCRWPLGGADVELSLAKYLQCKADNRDWVMNCRVRVAAVTSYWLAKVAISLNPPTAAPTTVAVIDSGRLSCAIADAWCLFTLLIMYWQYGHSHSMARPTRLQRSSRRPCSLVAWRGRISGRGTAQPSPGLPSFTHLAWVSRDTHFRPLKYYHHTHSILSKLRVDFVRRVVLTLWRDAHCCHMGTAIKHPVPDRVKSSFVIFSRPY